MAALIDHPARGPVPELADLRRLRAGDLDPLLREEVAAWERALSWDFSASASLVRRFVDAQALNGFALMARGTAVGYVYYIFEEHKGLIGDVYVGEGFRTVDNENRLLGAAVETLISTPFVRRVECQLMMLAGDTGRAFPFPDRVSTFDRAFMVFDLAGTPVPPPGRAFPHISIETWEERHQEAAAQVIASAYSGHIDSQINDQYHSVAGARRFLANIVQFPGCGAFFQPASCIAVDPETRRLQGISLTSLVAYDVGHITQICVAPSVRGRGVGYEVLRHSLEALRGRGCRKVGLTVTSANRGAIRLYDSVGFHKLREFAACVWEGFR
ncbi:MAG: GNAT family N-acetyltransferase [Bryobacteraceae bacterium]